MKYIFDEWNEMERKLKGKNIFLFLDYDGTLTPIVEHPEEATLSFETKELLNKLAKSPKCKLAIVSGRALRDVKNMVGLNEVIYVGNHGLEIEGPKIKFESPVSSEFKNTLQKIKEDLEKKLAGISGVMIEDKGLTLSLHYRLVKKEDHLIIKNIFNYTVQPYLVKKKIKIKPGKKVLEIRPPIEWDKGKVVLWLIARWKFSLGDKDIAPVYIGDDITDEDAFKALRNKGITIFVGRQSKSYAKYYLKDTDEVGEFLSRIAA